MIDPVGCYAGFWLVTPVELAPKIRLKAQARSIGAAARLQTTFGARSERNDGSEMLRKTRPIVEREWHKSDQTLLGVRERLGQVLIDLAKAGRSKVPASQG